jgi:hypothetical protein
MPKHEYRLQQTSKKAESQVQISQSTPSNFCLCVVLCGCIERSSNLSGNCSVFRNWNKNAFTFRH